VSAGTIAAAEVAPASGNPTDRPCAVVTRGLTKRFAKRLAVDSVDLRIPAGSITGFVGQNGAGKTTTIRMLLGLIRPTAGTGMVLGEPIGHARAYLGRVGALIEGPTFYPPLSGRENLQVLARLGGLKTQRVEDVLERVGLGARGLDPFRTYSLGMRQRLGIAAALLPEPELLVLDEPTNGLDPHGIAEIRALMRSFADEGMTVFVSSHLLAEIQQICEHLVVIDAGRLLFQGGVEELLAARTPELIVRTENEKDATRLMGLVIDAGHSACIIAENAGVSLQISADCSWAAELNRLAMAGGITLVHLSEKRSTLEEAFFEITSSRVKEGTHRGADMSGASAKPARRGVFKGARK
jgi:ABC-2 type transport system ATP-binding protein